MEGDQGSSESGIINIAINIFQNVGIRRWIEEIEILKNQQIYFEICKIIFPETIIHLFRLSENHSLTTGQKIQGVIDLIAKIIKNDLYHISGQAIANGRITHLKNFLQLLEALSNSMITRDRIEVESAPENDQSMTYNEHNKSYYTVIGMEKEFGDMTIFEGQQENHPNQSAGDTTTTVVEDPPLPPIDPTVSSHDEQSLDPYEQKASRTPLLSVRHEKETLHYPQPLRDKNSIEFNEENGRWVETIKVMNFKKENLQKQRLEEAKQAFLRWKANQDFQAMRVKQQIESESKHRKNVINAKINQREVWLDSLKGEQQAAKAIKNLFKQQKNRRAEKKAQVKVKELQSLKRVSDFREINDLLKIAINSKKPDLIYKGEQ